jgi:hypothetical protein
LISAIFLITAIVFLFYLDHLQDNYFYAILENSHNFLKNYLWVIFKITYIIRRKASGRINNLVLNKNIANPKRMKSKINQAEQKHKAIKINF